LFYYFGTPVYFVKSRKVGKVGKANARTRENERAYDRKYYITEVKNN